MEFFKGDETEQKFYNSGSKILNNISVELSEFFSEAYATQALGELVYDQRRFPLTNAIKRSIFISSFKQLFEAWAFSGTFESYIDVFTKIFGEDVVIDFTVPGPGELLVDITTTGLQDYEFVARSIEEDEYLFDNVVDDEDDFIVFSTLQGIESQSELEKVLFTMVPNGIFTQVSLTIGA